MNSNRYDEELEIAFKETCAENDRIAAEMEAWCEENKEPATGFGMLYDESIQEDDEDDMEYDLRFSVDVKWAKEYTKESRWNGPGAGELKELLNEAVRQWARLYAPKGTLTSFVGVDKP